MAPPVPAPYECLCLGIAVADHFCVPVPHLPAAGELVLCDRLELGIGGCAANVSADLAKLGVNVALAARVGDDIFGTFVAEKLRDEGVDTRHLVVTPGCQTSG